MKTLSEFRQKYDLWLNATSGHLPLRVVMRKTFDFDVYLTSYGHNLQRGYVWNLKQKQELIMSILIGRKIPPVSIVVNNEFTENEVSEVIDGKQRLSTIILFIHDNFKIDIDGSELDFSELPLEYKNKILSFSLEFNMIYSNFLSDGKMTDDQKIDWFRFLNFSGTEQDKEHLNLFDKQNKQI